MDPDIRKLVQAHNAAEQLAEALAVELRAYAPPTAAPAEQWTAAAGEVEPATLTDRRLRVPVRLVYDSPVSSLSSQVGHLPQELFAPRLALFLLFLHAVRPPSIEGPRVRRSCKPCADLGDF